jgi:ribonuclease J
MTAAAKSVGLFADIPPFVDDNEAGYFPPDKILYLCTGSQGEVRPPCRASPRARTRT